MPANKTLLVAIIVATSLGFAIGTRSASRPQPQGELLMVCETKYDELKEKFSRLNDVDFEEYARLKSSEERFKKADEILGKILQIFLADLGLRVSGAKLDAVKTSVASAQTQSKADVAPTTASPAISSSTQSFAESASTSPTAGSESSWRKEETSLEEVRAERDAKEFLDTVEIKDLFSEFKRTKLPSPEQVQVMNGNYRGQVVYLDNNKPSTDVVWRVNGAIKNDRILGNFYLEMFENGRQVSRTNGEGTVREVSALEDSGGLLVDARGGHGYFQLYYSRQMNRFIGNYYEKVREGEFRRAGTVELTPTRR